MKEDTNKILFGIGCIFLTLGMLSVTILPVIVNSFDMFVFITTSQYKILSFFLYTIATISFMFTYGYYKKELLIIFANLLYFALFLFVTNLIH